MRCKNATNQHKTGDLDSAILSSLVWVYIPDWPYQELTKNGGFEGTHEGKYLNRTSSCQALFKNVICSHFLTSPLGYLSPTFCCPSALACLTLVFHL